MASALLVSRNEPSWYGNQACKTKHPTSAPGFHYQKFHTNPNPYPCPDQTPDQRQIYNAGRTIHAHNVVADNRLPYPGGPAQKPPNAAGSKMFPHRTVTFKLAAYTRAQLKDLQKRLISELEQVRSLRNRIESANIVTRPVCPPLKVSGTKKGSVGRPANPLNRVKGSNPKRRVGRPPRESRAADGLTKQCSQILQKLMKHQFSWIFNTPVDVKALGLHDYHLIIHAPMDLGTVKSKLRKKFYASPLEFAADVRLTFNNALTYNPKGDDANTMAGLLLTEFEEMFKALLKPPDVEQRPIMVESLQEQDPVVIEDCARDGYGPVSSKGSEVEVVDARNVLTPKGMDIRDREMSFEEKQQLGRCLGDLPPEKMAEMMEILRNRNGYSTLDGDEIEVDIDALDSETLWELERFVAHHKTMVCESRCQESLPESLIQVPDEELRNEPVVSPQRCNKAEVAGGEEDVDIGDEVPVGNYPPVEIERDDAIGGCGGPVASHSKSVSSSSSGSGSSSSSGTFDELDGITLVLALYWQMMDVLDADLGMKNFAGSDSGSSDSDSDADSVQSPFVG